MEEVLYSGDRVYLIEVTAAEEEQPDGGVGEAEERAANPIKGLREQDSDAEEDQQENERIKMIFSILVNILDHFLWCWPCVVLNGPLL